MAERAPGTLRKAAGRVIAVVTSLACAYLLFMAVGIARDDIAARERLATGVTDQAFVRQVGQIFSVSPDGLSTPKFVCAFALDDDGEIPISRVYFNRLGSFLPKPLSAEIEFRGRLTEFGDANITGFVDECDPCALIDEVNARRTLCLSEKLLEEGDAASRAPLAARFRQDAMKIEEALFLQCGREFSPAAKAQTERCPIAITAPWTVDIRKFLGVIDHRPL
jgi:hypothetical protein